MGLRFAAGVVANFILIVGLVVAGLRLFAQYQARGKWAKNISSLLAGIGMMVLAFALLLTPRNALVVFTISQTKAYLVFLIASNALLLAAIAAFGVINYWKPARLLLERHIERNQKSELPKVP